jgi:hypothetical protein
MIRLVNASCAVVRAELRIVDPIISSALSSFRHSE